MAHALDVSQLAEGPPASGMDGIRDKHPAGHLFGRVDAGREGITLALRRNLRRFSDDQAR